MQKPYILLLVSILFMVIVSGCLKDGIPKIHIDGFDVTDNVGNAVTHIGPADNDWTFNNTLTQSEMDLFDFPAGQTLDNTTQAPITNKFSAYPNPCGPMQNFHTSTSDSVLLKMVFVNKQLQVLKTVAIKFKGILNLSVDYTSDLNSFSSGTAVRVYYSFSALGKPNFKSGYGDIKLCYGSGGTPNNYSDCF